MARRSNNRNRSVVRSPDQVGGGTFAAARARRELAADIMRLEPARLSGDAVGRPDPLAALAASVPVSKSVSSSSSRVNKKSVQGPLLAANLRDDENSRRRDHCKPRADGTRRSGSGARRPFVPWCK